VYVYNEYLNINVTNSNISRVELVFVVYIYLSISTQLEEENLEEIILLQLISAL